MLPVSADLLERLQAQADQLGLTVEGLIDRLMEQSQRFVAADLERERLEGVLKKEQEWNATVQRIFRMLSHDLRIPLTVISTSSGILYRHHDRLTPDERHQKITSIGTQIRRMTTMIDDAAVLVRGSLTRGVLQANPVNLESLCEVCVREIQDATTTLHTLRFITDGQIQHVLLDETLISRVLVNLLTNAVKYSPQGGEVVLALRRDDEHIVLTIRDHGIGIEPDDLPHLFVPLFRAKTVGNIEGMGLGLSIVKDCVELHQGSISVESALGNGTTFTVRLPLILP
jgi:signal transduction histidine kinase